MTTPTYIAIDLKSFYASCECVERGLDPLTTYLTVADASRTDKTICLAVSPALKSALNVPGRLRLFELKSRAKQKHLDFIIAPPQMRKYMAVSQQIFAIYASFVATEDIHVYSIDEVFIDVTPYLKMYHESASALARRMMRAVLDKTGITATAGIGTNLYLAKIAMDIMAKKMPPDSHGTRVAELDETSYRRALWDHQPLTDFWRIGPGYARRLAGLGIHTMGELARYSLTGYDKLYRVFGINAELLIDHAWGHEPVTIKDIKSTTAKSHSISSGQVLHSAYPFDKARLVAWEMADSLALSLLKKGLVSDQLVLTICYDHDFDPREYRGPLKKDHYGRTVPSPAHGSERFDGYVNSGRVFREVCVKLFDKIVNKCLKIRAIYVVAEHVVPDSGDFLQGIGQMSLLTDYAARSQDLARDRRLDAATAAIKRRYGANALLRAANFEDGATQRERNREVGGHHE